MKLYQLFEIIKKGEGEKIEFKEDYTTDLGKEICALANAQGGYIVIGVDDEGKIMGYKTRKLKEKISSFLVSLIPSPKMNFYDFKIDKKRVLAIKVAISNQLCTIGNTAYIRVGTSKRMLTLQELFSEGAEKVLLSVDKAPTHIEANQINSDCLEVYSEGRKQRGLSFANKTILKNLGIIQQRKKQAVLSLAGVLCFLKNPQQYYPFVSIRFKWGNRWKQLSGCLFEMIDEAVRSLSNKQFTLSVFEQAKRKSILSLPSRLVREAIVNALVHRNYALESETFVYIGKNEIKISNPGSFPAGMDLEDPRPIPRNPLLYEILFQSGYVEKEGQGINMMKEESQKLGLEMEYKIKPKFTDLIFRLPQGLSPRELEILGLLRTKQMSSQQLAQALDISRVAILRHIKSLRNKNKVEKIRDGRKVSYGLRLE